LLAGLLVCERAAKMGSTNVRRDLRDVWGAVETKGAPRPHRVQAGVAAATGLKIAFWRLTKRPQPKCRGEMAPNLSRWGAVIEKINNCAQTGA